MMINWMEKSYRINNNLYGNISVKKDPMSTKWLMDSFYSFSFSQQRRRRTMALMKMGGS